MIKITEIRMQHIQWSEEIQKALKKGKLPEITSYCDCNFGIWLGSNAKLKYASLKEMAELEKKHKEFHSTAADMVNYIKIRDYDNAEILLGEFRRESKDLVFMLSLLEYRLYNAKV